MEKSTGQLMSELNEIISIEDFHRKNAPAMQIPDAAEYILAAAAAKNICRSELVNRSGLDRTYAEHLLGGRKRLMREKSLFSALQRRFPWKKRRTP